MENRIVHGRSVHSDPAGNGGRTWLARFGSERERAGKERKGWSVTVHDRSGSPVALASVVTPFVASPGSDRVSRSNPGGWLIMRPVDGTWTPWGRLECWRERGAGAGGDLLGYRFELVPDHTNSGAGVCVAESGVPASRGGRFAIDLTAAQPFGRSGSPGCSPRGSGDLGPHGLWPFGSFRGLVMAAATARAWPARMRWTRRRRRARGAPSAATAAAPRTDSSRCRRGFVLLSLIVGPADFASRNLRARLELGPNLGL